MIQRGGSVFGDHLTDQVENVCQEHIAYTCWQCLGIELMQSRQANLENKQMSGSYLENMAVELTLHCASGGLRISATFKLSHFKPQ